MPALLAEAAVWLEDRGAAERVLPLAGEYAGLNLMGGEFLAMVGSADRCIGALESLLDDRSAGDHFAAALAMDTRMRSPVHVGTTLAAEVAHLRRIGDKSGRVEQRIGAAEELVERHGLARVRRLLAQICPRGRRADGDNVADAKFLPAIPGSSTGGCLILGDPGGGVPCQGTAPPYRTDSFTRGVHTTVTVNEPSAARSVGVGDRIRAARENARISVRELARRAEVSPSHVSQVERGLASFSVRTLYKVAGELGLSMDTLFGDAPAVAAGANDRDGSTVRRSVGAPSAPRTEDPLVANGTVLRAEGRPSIPLAGGTRWERLTARPENGAEFIEVVYPPAGPNATHPKDFIQHPSREYGLVMSGTLTVQVGFDTATLSAGDSIVFNSVVPHRFWNETPEEVRAVWFIQDLPDFSRQTSEYNDSNAFLRHHGADSP